MDRPVGSFLMSATLPLVGGSAQAEDDTSYNGALSLTEEPEKLRTMARFGFAADLPEHGYDLLYYKKTQRATGVEIE